MSKEIEWGALYGVGTVVCTCDNCSAEEEFEFEHNNPDFKAVQEELKKVDGFRAKLKENGTISARKDVEIILLRHIEKSK